MPTCCRKGDPEYEDPVIYIGEVLNQKKDAKFHTWEGGSGQIWVIFIHFLFALIHANLKEMYILKGDEVPPLLKIGQFWICQR